MSSNKDSVNIVVALTMILFVIAKFLFYFGDEIGAVCGLFLLLFLIILSGLYYNGRLDNDFPTISTFINDFFDFLSPKNPKKVLALLKTYCILAITVLFFSLLGPWFVYEANWTHVFDNSWYSDESGKMYSHRYGLTSVKEVTYNYSDWGEYSTSSQTLGYDINGFQNRQDVGSKTLTLVAFSISLWSTSAFICLYFLSSSISGIGPKIKNLKEVEHLQNSVMVFLDKLENLQYRGINTSSFNQTLEDISGRYVQSIQVDLLPSKSISFFLAIFYTTATISFLIALLACIQFGEEWADAMHTESGGDDGYCGVCENVDSFVGYDWEVQSTASGYYDISINWGGGWGREIILWLGTLSFLGIIRNSILLSSQTKESIRQIKNLESDISAFKMPEIKKYKKSKE